MRGSVARIVVGGVFVLSLGLSVSSPASASGSGWSTATSIPGLEGSTGLNVGGIAQVSAISCSSAGNCSEGGEYYDSSNVSSPFVATETNGSWSVQEVPGIIALETLDLGAQLATLSCSSAGNCAAGGYYEDASGQQQGFFVDEVGGVWQLAQSPPSLLSLDQGYASGVSSVSCSSDGSCAAVGYYLDQYGNTQGFVARDVNGVWSTDAVPSLITLNAAADHNGNGDVDFSSLSCSSAGNCDAVGYYRDSDDNFQGFVANEVNGTWTAYAVPSLLALNDATDSFGNPTGSAGFSSVSCWSVGNCAGGGYYRENNSHNSGYEGFVATEVSGTWTAYDVPTLDTLNAGGYAQVSGVSCTAEGSCTAVGNVTDSSGTEDFYLTLSGGVWGAAEPVEGLAALNTDNSASYPTVSCSSAGNCAIGGFVQYVSGADDAFVANESNGVWSNALLVPGLQDNNTPLTSYVSDLSCASDGSCLVGGTYGDAGGNVGLDFISSFTPAPVSSSGGSLAAVTNLVSNEVPGSITASWTPSSGATSYTCTLLFAIDDPLTFSTTTTSPTCSFDGLSTNASYGVRVVANDGDVTSAFTDTYASYPPSILGTTVPSGAPAATGGSTTVTKATSIVCVKGKDAKRIRGVDPHCPKGYHQRIS